MKNCNSYAANVLIKPHLTLTLKGLSSTKIYFYNQRWYDEKLYWSQNIFYPLKKWVIQIRVFCPHKTIDLLVTAVIGSERRRIYSFDQNSIERKNNRRVWRGQRSRKSLFIFKFISIKLIIVACLSRKIWQENWLYNILGGWSDYSVWFE